MHFEWDTDKARTNLTKHGVPFDEALPVFLDMNRLDRYDSREDYGEDRFLTIGLVDDIELAVAYYPTRRHHPHHFCPKGHPP